QRPRHRWPGHPHPRRRRRTQGEGRPVGGRPRIHPRNPPAPRCVVHQATGGPDPGGAAATTRRDANPEGAREPVTAMFRSLGVFNYRVWFIGALMSNIGTWMQRTAQDWIVLTELTDHDAAAVGITMAL